MAVEPGASVSLPADPYRGLVPYEEADKEFFFGRDGERDIICANLTTARLTVVYGESGVGKSSVLRAAVAPHFHELARVQRSEGENPSHIVVLFSSWRENSLPKLDLATTLYLQKVHPGVSPTMFGDLRTKIRRITSLVDCTLLFILDQFDEYFLYHPEETGPSSFFEQFRDAVNDPELRANFLISLRDDSLSMLDRFKGHIPRLFDNYLRIRHLSEASARLAITLPLEKWQPPAAIEKELVEEVIRSVRADAGLLDEGARGLAGLRDKATATIEGVETPYLQLVMRRLWQEESRKAATPQSRPFAFLTTGRRKLAELLEQGRVRLRLKTLQELGGAERIVQNHVDDNLLKLKASEQNIARQLFYYLVTPSRTKVAYSVADLASYLPQYTAAEIRTVVEKLSRADVRILRPVDADTYELFHDVLARAILAWRVQSARTFSVAGSMVGALAVGMAAGFVVLVLALVLVWPDAAVDRAAWLGPFPLTPETRYLLIAMITGGLGAMVHVLQSLGVYVGRRNFYWSWIWWYLLRPFIGANSGLIVYLLIRGVFVKSGGAAADLNPFSIACFSGLAGLFSKQLTDKLREIFDRALATEGRAERTDTLESTPPGRTGANVPK
jgi:hypothetical protein